ncbi:Sua5/YciO/YrdC/YwlC family protein [Mycoplasmopsis cynos]|uniref:Sua5/YciO/YrdC/YwlC family protein n=1 Tax=Mycoplasmopsis cynos TaxID=171284 RepID=UPI002AFF1236|nr:Sua5/YciO/YrdC/YwlC family protein [Mycoplasmopsis cynos]WQQ18748.1 Sua5/YciO/YrdC/YwlC family protein [Mycoplasmopsis cynos]
MNEYDKLFITTTDTIVGIGGIVSNEVLDALYSIKNRPREKKIIILVSSIDQARTFKEWNERADELAKKVWPGAVTIIINNQGFRMPNQKGLLKLIDSVGPVYMTSANISGQKTISIDQANEVFPNIKNIYNFGKPSGKPSDIYNLDTNEIIKRN